jgi:hypothetical protein
MFGNGDKLVPLNHERRSGLFVLLAAFIEHRLEALPDLGRCMLAAKLALAVTPAAKRYGCGKPLVDAGCVDRDSHNETASDYSDFVRIHLFLTG